MMKDRRNFLKYSGSGLGAMVALQAVGIGALFNVSCARKESGLGFTNLTSEEAAELEAIAGHIIPTTDTPGAIEAGVIYFVDAALDEGMPFSGMLPLFRQGLGELSSTVANLGGEAASFSALVPDERIEVLKGIEDTPFFGAFRTLTIVGFFADPKYGGNKDGIGWDLIGLDNRHAWQPPFGYYDEKYLAEGGTNG